MTDSAIQHQPTPKQPVQRPVALVVMGVSGCGKSSAGQAIAQALGWQLLEGDAYHADSSVQKMQAGIALTDADRQGWLARLAQLLGQARPGAGIVLTCSALKRQYREQLRGAQPRLCFVFLELDYATALSRVQQRAGHFFSPDLVANQFATLQAPHGESDVLSLAATAPLDHIAQQVQSWLGQWPSAHQMPHNRPQETQP